MDNCKTTAIALKDITITGRFWAEKIAQLAKEVIPYQWEVLNDHLPYAEPSHAIENFRIAAGESTGAFHGMVFQDSDVAKWIEAASYSLFSHPDPELERRIDDLVALMAKAQQPDGYLNTYYTVAKPEARWTDFSFGHELYCAGHLIEAAVAYYQATGKRRFLELMCRYADYIDSVMGPADNQIKAYCGHEEIELALLKLYRVTGQIRYLKLSQYFIDQRGQNPCFLGAEPTFNKQATPWFEADYHQAHLPVREQVTAEGHAVRAMYLYTAMADLAVETGDASLIRVLQQLWENVTGRRMYITGGLGSQGHGERFTFDYDLPNDAAYAETCAAIGLIYWAHQMLLLGPDSRYGDVLEQALYNSALSGISLDGKKYFYVNPLEVEPNAVAGRYDLQHVKAERQQWFGCACCPPNIARLITSLGQYSYSQTNDTIYAHLYLGCEAQFIMNGISIGINQDTQYPFAEKITFTINPESPAHFTLALRIPGWCPNYGVQINGVKQSPFPVDKGYLQILRHWNPGDQIELELAMPPELIGAHPKVRATAGKVAIRRGPVVYCLEEVDNGADLWDITLPQDNVLTLESSAEFEGIPVIKGVAWRSDLGCWENTLYQPAVQKTKPVAITAIPYYLWGNRKPGEMVVWITTC